MSRKCANAFQMVKKNLFDWNDFTTRCIWVFGLMAGLFWALPAKADYLGGIHCRQVLWLSVWS